MLEAYFRFSGLTNKQITSLRQWWLLSVTAERVKASDFAKYYEQNGGKNKVDIKSVYITKYHHKW